MRQSLLNENEKVRSDRLRRRMLVVLRMCATPKSMDEIKRVVTTTGINKLMANLKGYGLLQYNQSLKKYEANNIEVI